MEGDAAVAPRQIVSSALTNTVMMVPDRPTTCVMIPSVAVIIPAIVATHVIAPVPPVAAALVVPTRSIVAAILVAPPRLVVARRPGVMVHPRVGLLIWVGLGRSPCHANGQSDQRGRNRKFGEAHATLLIICAAGERAWFGNGPAICHYGGDVGHL